MSDDCFELNTLRSFRDGYMSKLPQGKEDIRKYYETAPLIVKAIDNSEEREAEYDAIYSDVIKPCVEMISNGDNESAYSLYKKMVVRLEKKYC